MMPNLAKQLAMSVLTIGVLAGCQSDPKPAPAATGKSAALRTMEQVAIAAQKCWFASGDAAFRDYGMANELNSFSGRPRILLVPRKDREARPLLVVQASGPAGQVEVFGPMMAEAAGPRIAADVRRWSSGDGACGKAA